MKLTIEFECWAYIGVIETVPHKVVPRMPLGGYRMMNEYRYHHDGTN